MWSSFFVMAEREERRRFSIPEGKTRDKWTEEQRKKFLENADKLKPMIEHLTTPAPTKKEKSFLEELFS